MEPNGKARGQTQSRQTYLSTFPDGQGLSTCLRHKYAVGQEESKQYFREDTLLAKIGTPRKINSGDYVRFEFFAAVTMKNGVFWDVTPCGSCKKLRLG
jgi:hypothetical protein